MNTVLGIMVALIALAVAFVALKVAPLRRRDWRRNLPYLADPGGLFGAAALLKCHGEKCGKTTYELFYGHCKECATAKGIPMKGVSPEAFQEALNKGRIIVEVEGKC